MIGPILSDYFQRNPDAGVLAAYLFGSHARGDSHRESDVDVGVLLDRSKLPTRSVREDEQLRLTTELIAALNVNEVDVVILNDGFPDEMVEALAKLPGFRNVLMHDYVRFDLDRAVAALRSLEPVEEFARLVATIEAS